jgi:hypothetical protein
MRIRGKVLLGAGAAFLAAVVAWAGELELVLTLAGDSQGDLFGLGAAWIGDVDGDDRPDFAVGAQAGGYVHVYSGNDGSKLYTLTGGSASENFFCARAAGDVDRDGCPDIIVGASQASSQQGYARVFSGRDGTTLYTFRGDAAQDYFGSSATGAGDVNADGYADLIVGSQNRALAGNAGYARVFSGKD